MRLLSPGRPHLTYCTNVHAAEGWAELRNVLEGPVAAVARAVHRESDESRGASPPSEPFGVGLRVSARAARELRSASAREQLVDVLGRTNAYIFTLNGFPYGPFHGAAVKERVYRPDWREDERVDYTRDLADLLAAVLPEDVPGSISTVPGAFAPRARWESEKAAMVMRLVASAAELVEIERRTGRAITLALEPEPACVIETARDAALFFRKHLFTDETRRELAARVRVDPRSAEALLRRHLGVCLDACHVAVAFEDPEKAVSILESDGIAIAKLQLSAGVEVEGADLARQALGVLDDGIYLHQTSVATPDGRVLAYVDLPDALREAPDGVWRVHAHVPINREPEGPLGTTRHVLERLLRTASSRAISPHLEVETYTWSVLPRALRGEDLVDDVARELLWARAMVEGR